MDFFHLRTVPGCQWPALPDSVFAQIWNAYLELDRSQWLDRAQIEERQVQQVRTLLAHCLANVPYYRDVLSRAGISANDIRTMDDFRKIPMLPRRTFQERNAEFVATSLPPGTVAREITQTSGSSGTPTNTHTTNMSQLWWYAFYLRDLEWCGIDPTGSLAVIRYTGEAGARSTQMLQGITLPSWYSTLDALIQMGPSHAMDIRQDPRKQLEWLRRLAPDYLLSYPANLETLAQLVRAEGRISSLRAIQSISNNLSLEAQQIIECAFGVPVRNCYSCNETGYLASPCLMGSGFHVHAENVILEVLDSASRPCEPGQTGRVVVTHLHNLRSPLIRYELGDHATLGPLTCVCRRGLPHLASITGKAYPMFYLPDGRARHSTSMATLLRGVGNHWQHQVVQKTLDHVVLRLAVTPTWTDQHAEQMKRAVQEFFEAPIRVDLEVLDYLAVPKNGKFQSMINELPPK